MTIDPNLWASLAENYTGGIAAPVAGQAGYVAVVSDAENNLEYLPAQDVFDEIPLAAPDGTVLGHTYRYHRQLVTTTTATQTLFEEYLPAGMLAVSIYRSGVCAGGARSVVETCLYQSDGAGVLTNLYLDDADGSTGTITGTFATATVAAGKLLLQCDSAAGDGSTTWTTTIEIVQHGA